ncbi:MAG TPA: hypothetical protein VK942_07710 [Actinomycetes bacterium]|nr:hypothetical protein [Actinomycetes bacterium]
MDEPALARPWLPEQGDQLHRALPQGADVAPFEQLKLGATADEWGDRSLVDIHTQAAARPGQPPDRHGLRLALDPDRLQVLVLELRAGRAPGGLADQDAVDRRHPL